MKRNLKYWSERAFRYWFTRHSTPDTETLKVILKQNLEIYKPRKVLEIGCGPGIFTEELSKAAEIVSIDLSNDMLRFVKNREIKAAFVQAYMNKLPFKNGSFDAIVAYRVLEYSDSVEKNIKRIF